MQEQRKHMQRVSNRLIYVALATMLVAGCSDTESATDLNPEGPPMIRQVRMYEKYLDNGIEKSRRVFAFGSHELADESEVAGTRPEGMVTTAAAIFGVTPNRMRIIVDELLVGNNLEQIACRAPVNAQGALSRVPIGATPDDIARCSVADDVLPRSCPGSNDKSVCICNNPGGCVSGLTMIAQGQPVGVLDIDNDGAPDETRMIDGIVQIRCDNNIVVPLDLDASYWNPSGDQNRPAQGGFEALGPAIVVQAVEALPTNVQCQIAFADGTDSFKGADGATLPAIVDKQGIQLCTPPNGDVEQACTPGDTSAFKFKVEPMALLSDTNVTDNAMNVPRNINAMMGSNGRPIDLVFNVPVKPSSLAGITITPALPADATITLFAMGSGRTVRISGPTLLPASTTYTLTITSALTDKFDRPLPQQIVIRFTTAAT